MPYPYIQAFANRPEPEETTASKIQTRPMPLPKNPTLIDAKTLHRAFCNDWNNCNKRYFGYRQTVYGIVLWMGKDIHNKHSIQLSDCTNGNCYIHCVLISEKEYGTVKIGDTVTIQGNYLECHPEFGVVLKYSEVID